MTTIKEQMENRRPLALRDLGCWTWLLKKLRHSGVTPNQISVLGMMAGLGAGALLAITHRYDAGGTTGSTILLTSIALIILRGACNIFDGVLAVETGRASRVGLLFNEVPDRVSDIAILVGAGYAFGSHPALGWAAALGALATAYLRVQVQLAGASADFSGPMAKPARMTVLCLAMAALALIPPAWWPAPTGRQDFGIIGAALALITAGTFATCIVRLRHACQELQTRSHHELS